MGTSKVFAAKGALVKLLLSSAAAYSAYSATSKAFAAKRALVKLLLSLAVAYSTYSAYPPLRGAQTQTNSWDQTAICQNTRETTLRKYAGDFMLFA